MASPADMGYDGMTFDQIQAHGRQHYRKKNYGAALEAFNAVRGPALVRLVTQDSVASIGNEDQLGEEIRRSGQSSSYI